MWTCLLLTALAFVSAARKDSHSPRHHEKEKLIIGGLFDSDDRDKSMQKAFILASDFVNERRNLDQFNVVPAVQNVDAHDNLKLSHRVCELLSTRAVAGMFGPHSVETSDHVQSLCDAMEIPHIETRWDSRQRRGSCLVNLYPHPTSLSKLFSDIVRVYGWESFTLIYENNDGLIRLHGLLHYYDYKGYPVTVRQLDEGGNQRAIMRRIKQAVESSKKKNIVLDCSIEILHTVLLHAQQVGLMGPDYSYLITSLDFHTMDLEPFMYSGTNITGIRLFDPSSPYVQEVMNFWVNKGENIPEALTTETAMVFDSVVLYAEAVNQLMGSQEVHPKNLTCDNNDSWEHGYSIINYMKVTEIMGLTGLIKFDHEGFRTDFEVDIIELTPEGLIKKGVWNVTNGVNFTQSMETMDEENAKRDLRNQTFIVMISLVDPHAMLKETTTHLVGNDKYEGMGIDVIYELSLMTGFNYTFREQEDGNSGNPDNVTGKWNGMLGKVINHEADLAIADITITRQREEVVDFTHPYMNLGISILYKKAKEVPQLFSFISPFTDLVWYSLCAAYVGVSFLMYVIARISPKEWTNPNPCIDDDDLEELENQFSLNNSFWFVTGSIMQQGSELAPISFSTRTLASAWWFFTLVMVSSYTANLAAVLTVKTPDVIFEDVDGLANQDPNAKVFVKYGAKQGGATEGFFKTSNHSTYQKMWTYMNDNYKDVMTRSNKEGVDRVLSETEEYAFLMESASIDYEVQRKCDLRQVGNPLDNKGYGIAMRKKEWYYSTLGSSVVKLQEKGKLTELYKKWWKEKRGGGACVDSAEEGAAAELDLDNVGGVFLVLVFGSLLACIIGLFELMFEVFMKEDKESFWKELKKELKFVISCKGTVKQLKPPASEDDTSVEEAITEKHTPRKSKTPNGLKKRSLS